MPDKIQFTGTILKSFQRTAKGGSAHFVANMTKSVATAMGWGDPQDWLTSATPDGDLHPLACELRPKEKELGAHSIELSASRLHKFEIVRRELESKNGKGFRSDLHFRLEFDDNKGAFKLEKYMLTIGDGKSALTVSYTKQSELDLSGPAANEDQKNAFEEVGAE